MSDQNNDTNTPAVAAPKIDLRENSRQVFAREVAPGIERLTNFNDIQLGCVLRIADALERIAKVADKLNFNIEFTEPQVDAPAPAKKATGKPKAAVAKKPAPKPVKKTAAKKPAKKAVAKKPTKKR